MRSFNASASRREAAILADISSLDMLAAISAVMGWTDSGENLSARGSWYKRLASARKDQSCRTDLANERRFEELLASANVSAVERRYRKSSVR